MTFSRSLSAALAVAASLLSAAPAFANDVPPGMVEHTVTMRLIEKIAPTHNRIASTVTENWVGPSASRVISRKAATGVLGEECTTDDAGWACYLGDRRNVIEMGSGVDPALGQSWTEQAPTGRGLSREGFRKVGERSDLGRPVNIFRKHHAAKARRRASWTQTFDADQATGYILVSVITTHVHGVTLRQTETVTTFELIDGSTVSLAMGPHPGAKIHHVDTVFGGRVPRYRSQSRSARAAALGRRGA